MTVTTTATCAATTTATRDRTDYSLGVDDAERARLLAQCAMHRTEAELLLDRVGLRPGDRALDLGCGPLGVLDLLAERVGPTGRVVGIDREKRYLEIARQELDARGLDGVELVAADATGDRSGAGVLRSRPRAARAQQRAAAGRGRRRDGAADPIREVTSPSRTSTG